PGTAPGAAPCCHATSAASSASRALCWAGMKRSVPGRPRQPSARASEAATNHRPLCAGMSRPRQSLVLGLGVDPERVIAQDDVFHRPLTLAQAELDREPARAAARLLRGDLIVEQLLPGLPGGIDDLDADLAQAQLARLGLPALPGVQGDFQRL